MHNFTVVKSREPDYELLNSSKLLKKKTRSIGLAILISRNYVSPSSRGNHALMMIILKFTSISVLMKRENMDCIPICKHLKQIHIEKKTHIIS